MKVLKIIEIGKRVAEETERGWIITIGFRRKMSRIDMILERARWQDEFAELIQNSYQEQLKIAARGLYLGPNGHH